MSNEVSIKRFYEAFQEGDYKTMNSFYSIDAVFRDEVFDLKGLEIRAMWHMLCEGGKDLKIEFKNVQADEESGSAYWEAWYTFSPTGRKVHNKISARFRFENGLIVEHIDSFGFWRWQRLALGFPGVILGWSNFLKKKVRDQAAKSLNAFISKHTQYKEF